MLTALFITYAIVAIFAIIAIVAIFAIIAFGWREELKTVRKELQSMKAVRGERSE